MTLRVLHIVSAYNRGPGDVITPWLTTVIERLREADVESEVLAPTYRGLSDQNVGGVPIHRYRYAPKPWEDLTHDETAPDRIRQRPWYLALVPGYVLSGMSAARRLVREGDFDVVHAHWPLPHALHGMAARRAGRLPLVCSFYGVELTWAREWPLFRPFLRHVIRVADAVTAISRYTAKMIRTLHDRDVSIIPFGAAFEDSRAIDTPHRPQNGALRVLFVGRLVERKGVHVLLEAVARLRQEYEVRLSVVGDGPLRPKLEARARQLGIQDHVIFHGFLSSDDLVDEYGECDIFVLPAVVDSKGDTEGLGVVLIEALAHERPVVASAVGGIPDIVRDRETGLLVPPGNANELAAAIQVYIEDPEKARMHASAGRAHVEAHFSWDVITERLSALYVKLVEARSSQGGKST